MKIVFVFFLAAMSLSQQKCNGDKKIANCYKGKLEIKALCSNYTISVLEGSLDTSKMMTTWTNEHTGKTYRNVFALGSPCSFPASIAEGDEFYFTLADSNEQCAVCQAYYPKPAKALSIKVLDKPCQ